MNIFRGASHSCGYLRLQVVSDTHLEFLQGTSWNWDEMNILVPEGNVLALLGDIGVCTSHRERCQLESFILWCCSRFQHVLYLAGNHEYYNLHSSSTVQVEEVNNYLSNLASQLRCPNFHFLNNSKIELFGVTILGSTLWSALPSPIAADIVGEGLNDYKLIYHNNRLLSTTDTHQCHMNSLHYLHSELTRVRMSTTPVVVLTHHTPSMHGTSAPEHENRNGIMRYMNHGFSTDLLSFIDQHTNNLRVWCYGHTHYNNQQMRGGTLIASNQRGYSHCLTKGYRPNYVITVGLDLTADANGTQVWRNI